MTTAPDPLKLYCFVLSEREQPIKRNLYGAKRYITDGWIKCRFGKHELEIPDQYAYDGASIPRLFWSVGGLSPLDDETILPSCFHDWVCEHPDEMPRVMGDALFVSMLGPHVWNGRTYRGARKCRRRMMYLAVRAYSTWRQRNDD